jgi:hypothetical protein
MPLPEIVNYLMFSVVNFVAISKWCIAALAIDSIDWSEIHHFEMALHSPVFKGIARKRYTYP